MAILPCSVCGRRYTGRAFAFYPAALPPDGRVSAKWKCCPGCGEDITTQLEARFTTVVDGAIDSEAVASCVACDQPIEGWERVALFCTWYQPGEDRKDAFGECHVACWARSSLPELFTYSTDASRAIQAQETPPASTTAPESISAPKRSESRRGAS